MHSCYRTIIRWHSHILNLLSYILEIGIKKFHPQYLQQLRHKLAFLQFLQLWKYKMSLPQPPPWEPEAYKLIDRIAADEGRFTNNNEVRRQLLLPCICVFWSEEVLNQCFWCYFCRWSSTQRPDLWRWTRKESILPSETKALASRFSQSR